MLIREIRGKKNYFIIFVEDHKFPRFEKDPSRFLLYITSDFYIDVRYFILFVL